MLGFVSSTLITLAIAHSGGVTLSQPQDKSKTLDIRFYPTVIYRKLPKADEWRKVFLDVIKDQERLYPNAEPTSTMPNVSLFSMTMYAIDSHWLVIPLSTFKPSGVNPEPYRKALVEALRDPDPQIRGQACWVVAKVNDLELAREVAKLLDDSAASLPIGNINRPGASNREMIGLKPRVQDFARWSISCMTGIPFTSQAVFDQWAARQTQPERKFWYWESEWDQRKVFELTAFLWARQPHRAGAVVSPFTKISSAFTKLPPDLGFAFVAQHLSPGYMSVDIYNELSDEERAGWRWEQPSMVMGSGFEPRDLKAYLKRKEVHEAALNYVALRGPKSPIDPLQELVKRNLLLNHGNKVFNSSDDERLKAIQNDPQTSVGKAEAIAVLRSRLNPKLSKAILSEFVEKNNDVLYAILELAQVHGSQAENVIVERFAKAKSYERTRIAQSLMQAVSKKINVSPQLVLKLAEVEPDKSPYTRDESICEVAELANRSTGKEVVSSGYIEAARWRGDIMPLIPDFKVKIYKTALVMLREKVVSGLKRVVQ